MSLHLSLDLVSDGPLVLSLKKILANISQVSSWVKPHGICNALLKKQIVNFWQYCN